MACVLPDRPCLGDGPTPPPSLIHSIYVYSNDGSNLIGSQEFYNSNFPVATWLSYYNGTDGKGIYLESMLLEIDLSEYDGLSYSPNQTVGEIELGTILARSYYDHGTIVADPRRDVTVYVVGGGGGWKYA